MLTGNKGDWSELYVFAKLLAEGKLFQSDIHLKKDENNIYEVVKAYREEGNVRLEFQRNEKVQLYIVSAEEKKYVTEYSFVYLNKIASALYNGVKSGEGRAFDIPAAREFITSALIKKLTAKISSKSDLVIRIYDHRLAKETDLGFSIKSFLGGDSTLLNTGPGNNFIYRIHSKSNIPIADFNRTTYKPNGKISKISLRIQKLVDEYESSIRFKGIQSNQLWRNLKMVDGDLPNILAFCLLYRWTDRTPYLAELVILLEKRDPLKFYNGEYSEQKLYEYKLKRFLAECAMGMTSETPWHGIYDATGGLIICKEDGDIVCFHIYDFNLFRNYLIGNTMFEQASTGEDADNPGNPRDKKGTKKYYYGWLYEDFNELLFKINLQVRFI